MVIMKGFMVSGEAGHEYGKRRGKGETEVNLSHLQGWKNKHQVTINVKELECHTRNLVFIHLFHLTFPIKDT